MCRRVSATCMSRSRCPSLSPSPPPPLPIYLLRLVEAVDEDDIKTLLAFFSKLGESLIHVM